MNYILKKQKNRLKNQLNSEKHRQYALIQTQGLRIE